MKKIEKENYKNIVNNIAAFSKSDRLKVGAIILKDNVIISSGYNSYLPRFKYKKIIINNHDISTIHAEQNCLIHCTKQGISTNNCEMVITHFPCQICTKLAIMAGIKKIYYLENYKNNENPFTKFIKIEKIN